MIKLVFFTILPLWVFIGPLATATAQTASLELTSNSIPTPDNNGPEVTINSIPFEIDNDNPGGPDFSTYRPEVTATITFSNPVFGDVTQDTDPNSSTDPSTVAGWDFTSGTGFIRNGASTDLIRLLSDLSLSNPTNSDFTSLETVTAGSGIDVSQNYAAWLSTSFETLRGSTLRCDNDDSGSCTENVDNRHQIADLTVTFNTAVDNPVLHILGLGGRWFIDIDGIDGTGSTVRYSNSGTVELDFLPGSSAGTFDSNPFSVLSGTSNLVVESLDGGTTTSIRNNADYPDVNNDSSLNGFGVGSGSVVVNGTDITTLAFRMYARGINGPIIQDGNATPAYDRQAIGTDSLGWSGGTGDLAADDEINFSSDTWLLGFSTAVEPDNQILTTADCYRMLSAPVDGTTYADLIADFWLQGQSISGTGVDYTDGSTVPNVFLWPTDGSTGSFSGWDELSSTDGVIEPGTGFLISVFEDDDFDNGTPDGFPKTISVTGSENAPPTVSGSAGTMSDGADEFSLLGNPFKSTIDWDNIQPANTSEVRNAVYVYDRSIPGYRSYVSDSPGGGGFGSLNGGLIEPFQGFFVQNTSSATAPSVDFTGAKATTDGSGSFYGKTQSKHNYVNFELNGESLNNSMWIWFSDEGSLSQTNGDALELAPLAYEYAMMGTRKEDGTIFDIGHYPIPDNELEIPVSFEATRSGNYVITATDLDLSFGSDLYFIDLVTRESIRIDENFRYEFSTEGVVGKAKNDEMTLCSIGAPQKAKTASTTTDRFMIATSPREFESEVPESVSLNQNYPNPFNPTTQITYQLPKQSNVRLEVYDLTGRQVATLVDETIGAGSHTVNFNAVNLSSGVYIYRLNAGNTVLSRKLTVIK